MDKDKMNDYKSKPKVILIYYLKSKNLSPY